jgi:hypothetical protein
MANFTDLTGLAGIALAAAALSSMALVRLPLSKRLSALATGSIFVLLLIPFGTLPLAAYVRGMVGDLSISTLVVLGGVIGRRLGMLPPGASPRRIGSLLLVILAAGALYPLALGAGAYDPYRLGYGEPWFLGLLLALAGIALRLPLVTASISLAVLAWAAGWYESGNLWDYLIDPLLAVYAVIALPFWLFERFRTLRRAGCIREDCRP